MLKKFQYTLLGSLVLALLLPLVARAEVVTIPYLQDIDRYETNENTTSTSRLGGRMSTDLQLNSTGESPWRSSPSGSSGSGDSSGNSGSSGGNTLDDLLNSSSDIIPSSIEGGGNLNITPPDINLPDAPNINVPTPSLSEWSAPKVDSIAGEPDGITLNEPTVNIGDPSYQVPEPRGSADIDTIGSNAAQLGERSSSAAYQNSENFRLNAENQATQSTQRVRNSNETNLTDQYNRGVAYATQGGDAMGAIDRFGQVARTLAVQFIELIVVLLFYASIIGAILGGFKAIIAIFRRRESPFYWIGLSILSVLVYVIIISFTGINIQSNVIADLFNWIVNG